MPVKILHAVGTFEIVSILDVVYFLCEIYRLSWKGQIILFLFYQDRPRCSQEQDDESLCYFTVLPPCFHRLRIQDVPTEARRSQLFQRFLLHSLYNFVLR